MAKEATAMHVNRIRRSYKDKSGVTHFYETALVRRSYRDSGKVKHETLANISTLPPSVIDAIEAGLKGKTLLVAGEGLEITRALAHGHVAVVTAIAKQLGFPELLGPPSKERDIALALIISRVVHPRSKLATTKWWNDTTLAKDLEIEDVGTDDVYKAMDWLEKRQEAIEAQLVKKHLGSNSESSTLAYFDLSSSWVEGTHNELAAHGYSRDKKRGKAQIEYGLLTDKAGVPLAIEVFPGNTADPKAFISVIDSIRSRFRIDRLTMVGDRGMITSARIDALRQSGDIGWLTCLRSPQIVKLAGDDGPLQLSLFDERDLAEFTHPDYPCERLIACRNPFLAQERTRKRAELLNATEKELAPIIAATTKGRLAGADKIGLRVGKVINKFKMAKHFDVVITDTEITVSRNEEAITAESCLDGIYVLRTTLKETEADSAGVVSAYKALSNVERDFRHIKVDDIDLRPIHHYKEPRVRSHVFIAMLAAYLVWHLREILAPLTFTDENRPERDNPVAPARRSVSANKKASEKKNSDSQDVRGFRELIDHLGTLTRNTMRTTTGEATATFDLVATPTPIQRKTFELLGVSVPLRLM